MNHRKYTLSTGLEIEAGKNAEDNDILVKQAKRNETLLHTEAPGSPFVNCGENPTKKEVEEAAIFCAKHSQIWRDKKADVIVNKFLKANTKKGFLTKIGTWKVKKQEKIKVKKIDIEKFEKN